MHNQIINKRAKIVILISANVEWNSISRLHHNVKMKTSPYGQWFEISIQVLNDSGQLHPLEVIYFHGGWGKISAAASTQYIIDIWQPELLINFGTCGGFQGEVERGTIILAEKTIVYDIIEQMYKSEDHINQYTTVIDLSWLDTNYPLPVQRSLLVSGDRDLIQEQVPELKTRFSAIAGDWESGAIAYVAAKNGTRTLILRGVSDLVGEAGGEAYDDVLIFEENSYLILKKLVESLPAWISLCNIL
jgi:adenosylhomocysteine nucleosidase